MKNTAKAKTESPKNVLDRTTGEMITKEEAHARLLAYAQNAGHRTN
jgi:hypothetical protein